MVRDGRGWRNESARHALAAKGVKTGRQTPIRMKPKLVPLFDAILDIDEVRAALKKKNLFFRSLVDAKVEIQRAIDNTAEGNIPSARLNLTKATGLLVDVAKAPDIAGSRRLASGVENAIESVRRAKQKLGEV